MMHAESVVFMGDSREPIEAALLFQPDTILSVTNAAADVRYVEDHDYYVDRQAGRIVRVPGSRMPCVTRAAVAAADGQLTHGRTVAVTYSHASGQWRGFVPANAGTDLPRTTRLLQQRGPLTICLTGDSISEGYDASGFHGLPPFQPPFAALVASALQQHTGRDV